MCGIYGFSGKNLDNKNLIILALQNMTRGMDSSGIYYESSSQYQHEKTIEHADELINDVLSYGKKGTIKLDKEIQIVIGHNRAKTVGSIIRDNAHPFLIKGKGKNSDILKNVVLCHNGTLKNHHSLITKFPKIKSKDVDVDSQLFVNYFAKYDNFDILKRYDGAAALLWKDIDTSVLHAYHDSERPLHYGFVDGDMYISSESLALNLIGAKSITSFDERKVYSIQDGKIIGVTDEIKKDLFPVVYNNNSAAAVNRPNTSVVPTTSIFTSREIITAITSLRKSKDGIIYKNYNLVNAVLKSPRKGFIKLNLFDLEMEIDIANFRDLNFNKPDKVKYIPSMSFKLPKICYEYKNFSFDFLITTKALEELKLTKIKDNNPDNSNSSNSSNVANPNKIKPEGENHLITDNEIICVHSARSILPTLKELANFIKFGEDENSEEVKEYIPCVCGNGWDEVRQEICKECDGEGQILKNKFLITEEQMDELLENKMFLEKLVTEKKDIFSNEEIADIETRIARIESLIALNEDINV